MFLVTNKKKSFLKDFFFKSPAKKNQFQLFSVAMSLLLLFLPWFKA